MRLKTNKKIKIYPKDIKRFFIISLGLTGYYLLLSVISDITLVNIDLHSRYSDFLISLIDSLFVSLFLLPLLLVTSTSSIRDYFTPQLLFVQLSAKLEILITLFIATYVFPDDKIIIVPVLMILFYILSRGLNVKKVLDVTSGDVTSLRLLSIGAAEFISSFPNAAIVTYLYVTQDLFAAFIASLLIQTFITYSRKFDLQNRYSVVIKIILVGIIASLFYSYYIG